MDKWLRNNNVVKIIALLLAIALWFVVKGTTTTNQPFKQTSETYRISEVALTAKVDKDRYAIVKLPKTVTLELKGTPSALSRNISPSDYQVFVDLTQVEKGAHTVPVMVNGFPSDLTVQPIPDKVDVVMEEKQKVEKEITIKYSGSPSDGYTAGEAILKPKKVHITLPESEIQDAAEVLASVNVDGAKDTVEQTVPLKVVDKKGNPLDAEVNPAVVEVTVPITSPYKVLPLKLSYVNSPPEGISINGINLKTDKVTVFGPKEVIDKMTYYPGPQIDLSTIKEDRYMQLKVPLVPNVVKIDPDFIELEVNASAATKKAFSNIPIAMNGLGQGLKATFTKPENGKLTLNLKGTPDRLKDLKVDDIQLYVDLSNLSEGDPDVAIHMNLPPFISTEEDPNSLHAVVHIQKTS
ncbi:MAG TPA: CdaR family protein [Bacillota bacterium]|nr:CdaR family protein [Bacillota bacterium]